jgi:hypothetical protein
MPLIDPEDFRLLSEDNMPDTCTIRTPGALVELDGGGWTTGAPTTATVACRLRPVREPDEVEAAGKLQEQGLEVLTVPLDAVVTARAMMQHTSARDGAVTLFNVVGVVPLGSFAVHRKVLVQRAAT